MTRESRGERSPRWLTWVTRISLVIGIAALIATVWIVGLDTILHHLRSIGWFFLVIVGIEIVSSALDGSAIYFMAHGPDRPTWRESVVAQLAGRGVNSVTPGGNVGEALKVGLLSKRSSPRRAVAAVMYVGLIGVVISLSVVAAGSAATAFLFDVPALGVVGLLVGAAIAAAAAIAIVVLVHHDMLTRLTSALARLHFISSARRDRWNESLSDIDARLSGRDDGAYRRRAIACIVISHGLQKGLAYFTILSAGYALSAGQFLAVLSAGVLVAWISTLIPMGLGISESGNAALFAVIGAPASLGIAYALARRVNQVVFALVGFIALAVDRLGSRVRGHLPDRLKIAR